MAETPICSCGANEPGRIICPCAGQANTGQVANLAAVELTGEVYGSIVCVTRPAIGDEGLVNSARNADKVVGIDGCSFHGAKGPSKTCTLDDVETVVSACWRGVGKDADASVIAPQDGSPCCAPDCGCGGGG